MGDGEIGDDGENPSTSFKAARPFTRFLQLY